MCNLDSVSAFAYDMYVQVAVEGCCHGELDKIYETIVKAQEREGIKVDLLLCCGDFQVCVCCVVHFSKMTNQNIKAPDTLKYSNGQMNSYKHDKMADHSRYFISFVLCE